jgi:hypothetical protein
MKLNFGHGPLLGPVGLVLLGRRALRPSGRGIVGLPIKSGLGLGLSFGLVLGLGLGFGLGLDLGLGSFCQFDLVKM